MEGRQLRMFDHEPLRIYRSVDPARLVEHLVAGHLARQREPDAGVPPQTLVIVDHPLRGRWLRRVITRQVGHFFNWRLMTLEAFAVEALSHAIPRAELLAMTPTALAWTIYRHLHRLLDDALVAEFLDIRPFRHDDNRYAYASRLARTLAVDFGDRPLAMIRAELASGLSQNPRERLWRLLWEAAGQPRHFAQVLLGNGVRHLAPNPAADEQLVLWMGGYPDVVWKTIAETLAWERRVEAYHSVVTMDYLDDLPLKSSQADPSDPQFPLIAFGQSAVALQARIEDTQSERIDLDGPASAPKVGLHTYGSFYEAAILTADIIDGYLRDRDQPEITENIRILCMGAEARLPMLARILGKRFPGIPLVSEVQPVASRHPLCGLLLMLVNVVNTRVEVGDILNLIETSVFRRCYRIDDEELVLIETLLRDTHTQWGFDARHREGFLGTPVDLFTWQNGIRRMAATILFDEASAGRPQTPKPLSRSINGSAIETVAKLTYLFEKLEIAYGFCSEARPLGQWLEHWQTFILECLPGAQFYFPSDFALLHDVFEEFETDAAEAVDESISWRVFYEALAERFSEIAVGNIVRPGIQLGSFPDGPVCPADLTIVTGIDDDSLRDALRPHAYAIHSMRGAHKTSDNALRYQFLEGLTQSGSAVHFLCDSGSRSPIILDLNAVADHLPLERRAHVPRIVSKDERLPKAPLRPRLPLLSAIDDENARAMPKHLEQWKRFLRDPLRYFAEFCLNIREPEDLALGISEGEANGLLNFQIRDIALRRLLNDEPLPRLRECIELGLCPPGPVGSANHEKIMVEARSLFEKYISHGGGEPQTNHAFDIEITADASIHGVIAISETAEKNLCDVVPSKMRPSKLLSFWMDHVLRCHLFPEARYGTTVCFMNETITFGPVSDAPAILESIASCVQRGTREPLPLFPDISANYAEAICKGSQGASENAWQRAWEDWNKPDYSTRATPSDAFYHRLFLGSVLPDDFGDVAEQIFLPLYDHVGNA